MALRLSDVSINSKEFTYQLTIKNSQQVEVAPLKYQDVFDLASFFGKLSSETRRLSTFKSYDTSMARELVNAVDKYDKLRFVARLSGSKEIIGLFEFSFDIPNSDMKRFLECGVELNTNTDCRYGLTVANDFQNQGLGSAAFPHMVGVAKQFGQKRMILFGGTLFDNQRAIHFYLKHGFKRVGEFINSDGKKCVDMVLEL